MLPSVASLAVRSTPGRGGRQCQRHLRRRIAAHERPRRRWGAVGRGHLQRRHRGERRRGRPRRALRPRRAARARAGAAARAVRRRSGTASGAARGGARQPDGARGQRHRRHRVEPRPFAADRVGPGHRRGDPDRCRVEPGQLRGRARRRRRAHGGRQHRRRGHRTRPRRADQPRDPRHHRHPHAHRPRASGMAGHHRGEGTARARARDEDRFADRAAGGGGRPEQPRRASPACTAATSWCRSTATRS